MVLNQGGAAGGHIAPGGVEVAGVPGVGHFLAGAVRVVQEQAELVLWVSAGDALHVSDVGVIHADDQIDDPIQRSSKTPVNNHHMILVYPLIVKQTPKLFLTHIGYHQAFDLLCGIFLNMKLF